MSYIRKNAVSILIFVAFFISVGDGLINNQFSNLDRIYIFYFISKLVSIYLMIVAIFIVKSLRKLKFWQYFMISTIFVFHLSTFLQKSFYIDKFNDIVLLLFSPLCYLLYIFMKSEK